MTTPADLEPRWGCAPVIGCGKPRPCGTARGVNGDRCIGCLNNGTRIDANRLTAVEPAARFMDVSGSRSTAAIVDDDQISDPDSPEANDSDAIWSPLWVQVDHRATGGTRNSNWTS